MTITAEDLASRLRGLDEIGVGPNGAVHRLAWTAEDAACGRWFEGQAAAAGLTPLRDAAGNLWACPETPAPWFAVGSHLDSVRGGGRFDGPLGVACGFAAAAASPHPIAVISFADEEGARFNTPTFGSKALAGRLDLPSLLERRDEHGTRLEEAMRRAGVAPAGLAAAPDWLERLHGFIEVHIDQATEVARSGLAGGVVSALAARLRLEVELRGRADHAGTTPPAERRDALAAAARLIVAADELAQGVTGLRVTTARILVEPNAATTIAAHVRLWVDARAGNAEAIGGWRADFERAAAGLAARTGVDIGLHVASRSPARAFAPPLREALRRAGREVYGAQVPEGICFAGHDAGVLAERIPAAMLLVRNRTGVSHAPQETVDLEDAAAAARVVLRALDEVAG